MAELKKFEYIIEFEPYYMENKIGELCFKSKKVKQLVRCRDCVYFQQFRPHDGFCKIDGMLWNNDFFCANGMREES